MLFNVLLKTNALFLSMCLFSLFPKICGSRPGMRLYDIVHNRILDCNFFSSEEKDAVKIVFSVVLQLRETLANLPSIHQTCAEVRECIGVLCTSVIN